MTGRLTNWPQLADTDQQGMTHRGRMVVGHERNDAQRYALILAAPFDSPLGPFGEPPAHSLESGGGALLIWYTGGPIYRLTPISVGLIQEVF
jgi:hypothetical protein